MKNKNIDKKQHRLPYLTLTASLSVALLFSGCHTVDDLPSDSATQLSEPSEEEITTEEPTTEAPTEPETVSMPLEELPELQQTPSLNAPEVSVPTGMYESSFQLTITAEAGQTVFYTLDGSDPCTSKTAQPYTGPLTVVNRTPENNVLLSIVPSLLSTSYYNSWNSNLITDQKVDKCTVLRAVAVTPDGQRSPVITHTYFVGINNQNYQNLAVISLVTDSDNLFNSKTGIYCLGDVFAQWRKENPWNHNYDGSTPANYNQRGREWEREAYVTLFDSNGIIGFSQNCGIRIQGGWSRAAWQKSLRLYARDDYGAKNFNYAVFDNATAINGPISLAKFKTLVLRNGGNDSDYTKFKDAWIQSLVSDRNFSIQTSRPAILFLNGEYWGIYTLQEDYTDHHFANTYGVDDEQVVFYKNWKIDQGTEEDNSDFWSMMYHIQNWDLSVESYYNRVADMIDLDSFIDYMATEIYINNSDWPGGNFGLWKVREADEDSENPYADGRWRMTLFDTEFSMNLYGSDRVDGEGTALDNNLKRILTENDSCLAIILQCCLANEGFRLQFINTMLDLMNVNFDPEHALAALDVYKELYLPELETYFRVFPNWGNIDNATMPCIERMTEFIEKRPSYVPKMLQTNFQLSEDAPVTLTLNTDLPKGGSIQLNSITPDLSSGTWQGIYLSDCPITLTAIPAEGYRFVSWEILNGNPQESTEESNLTVTLAAGANITAHFEKVGEELQ